MFIQIHTLTPYAAAFLSGDDNGRQKRLKLGGVDRARLSAQRRKRCWRDQQGALGLQDLLATSVQSRRIFSDRIARPLVDDGYAPRRVAEVLFPLQEILGGRSERNAKYIQSELAAGADPIELLARGEALVMSPAEIDYLTREAERILASLPETDDPENVAEVMKAEKRRIADQLATLRALTGADTAVFGRFVTGDRRTRMNAALKVAHGIGVCALDQDDDFFTQLDQLTNEAAGTTNYLRSNPLSSPIVYGYAVLEWPTLIANLQAVEQRDWRSADPDLAIATLDRVIDMAVHVATAARLSATASFTKAGLLLVEVGTEQPLSLADAFRTPTAPTLEAAHAALAAEIAANDEMLATANRRWLATKLRDATLPGATRLNVPALKAAVADTLRREHGAEPGRGPGTDHPRGSGSTPGVTPAAMAA